MRLLALVLSTVLLVPSSGCHGVPQPALVELEEARRLTADLRVQFSMAADASNYAVMADTDEASTRFARNAKQSAQIVEKDVAALTPLLESLRLQSELRSLAQFKARNAEYRKLDDSILDLAVENTNLKAQRLAFGPAREAADRFKSTLGALVTVGAAQDRCRVEALVAKAVLAVREIEVLQAPHIAEPDEATMTRMERDMSELTATATQSLGELAALVPPAAGPSLATAQAAFDQFTRVSAELVTLSRRNSDVRSLDLSLREKPALSASCHESLRVLEGALVQEGSKATR